MTEPESQPESQAAAPSETNEPVSIHVIQKWLESDRFWRERRHPQWTANYLLYRDTVVINRPT
jgi:hypothetical protein